MAYNISLHLQKSLQNFYCAWKTESWRWIKHQVGPLGPHGLITLQIQKYLLNSIDCIVLVIASPKKESDTGSICSESLEDWSQSRVWTQVHVVQGNGAQFRVPGWSGASNIGHLVIQRGWNWKENWSHIYNCPALWLQTYSVSSKEPLRPLNKRHV